LMRCMLAGLNFTDRILRVPMEIHEEKD